ncbi:hypothetical protein BH11CYA1_BH11CYA1_24260 [soil metagenome]
MTANSGQSERPNNDDSKGRDLGLAAEQTARTSLSLEATAIITASNTTAITASALRPDKAQSISTVKGSDKFDPSDDRGAPLSDRSEKEMFERDKDNFALKHQVLISQDATGKHLVYTIRSGDLNIDVLKTENNRESLAKAERQIEQLARAKESQLRSDYKLGFSKNDEEVIGQVAIAPDGTVSHGKMIYARAPHLAELYSIEGLLERATPSQLTKDGKSGVKFYFLKDSLYQDDQGAAATYRNSDKNGDPAIYVGTSGIGASLEKKGDSIEWQGGLDGHMVLHEFAHNTQFRLGIDEEKRLIQFSNRCGFAPFLRPGTDETIWALRSKEGKLYRHDNEVGGWQEIDDKGNLVTQPDAGKPKNTVLDDIDMAKIAEVRPPTYYFDNPVEMAAEGMAMLKENATSRKELFTVAPLFYQFMKELDQEDIDLAYGLDQGKAKLVRLPDGKLATNDEVSRKLILEFEKQPK